MVGNHDLHDVAEVVEQDLTIGENGEIDSYRTKLRLSFKYETALGAPEWEGQAARAAQLHAAGLPFRVIGNLAICIVPEAFGYYRP